MKKIAILFDLDGTLIDSTDAIVSTFYKTFKMLNFNCNITKKQITSLIGYPLSIMYEKFGVKENQNDKFVSLYKEEYRKISKDGTILLPSALESIQLAKKIARIGIVTTKTTKWIIPLLEYLGIYQYFEVLIGMSDVTNPKPHPEPILKAIKDMKLDNDYDIWMIGDTKLDLISANKALVNSIGVLSGYGSFDELSCYTQHIVSDSLEAVKLIKY